MCKLSSQVVVAAAAAGAAAGLAALTLHPVFL